MSHQIGRLIFGLGVGLLLATMAYRWAADTGPRAERLIEEQVVAASRVSLESALNIGQLEIVDPLSPDRKVGKAYIYRAGQGWEVSGFYRRHAEDLWHPYLVTLNDAMHLTHLKFSDTALLDRDGEDGLLEVLP